MACLGLGPGLIGVYGFFTEHVAREFGVGVAVVNLGPVALLLIPGLAAPFVGRLVDRGDIRRIMLWGAGLGMLALLLASQVPRLWMAGLAFLGFSLGLALYGPAVINSLLVKLYAGREARALAIAAIGISVTTVVLPPTVSLLLANMDWRTALAGLALAVWVLLWLVMFSAIPAGVHSSSAPQAQRKRGGRGFYRDANFWLIGVCVALGLNVAIILAVCYPPHFRAQGFTVTQAGWFLSISGGAGLLGKLLLASVADSLQKRAKWVAAAILMVQFAGLILLLGADTLARVAPACFLLGFSGGAFLPMHAWLNSCYFHADVIGEVTGAQTPLFLPLGLVGPPLAGLMFDRNGNYFIVLLVLAAIILLAALASVALRSKT